jgi:hypothetical protein
LKNGKRVKRTIEFAQKFWLFIFQEKDNFSNIKVCNISIFAPSKKWKNYRSREIVEKIKRKR